MSDAVTEKIIPLFPLPAVVFPSQTCPLHVAELRFRELIHTCITTRQPFVAAFAPSGEVAPVGCMVEVQQITHVYPTGEFDVTILGFARAEILGVVEPIDTLDAPPRARVRAFGDTSNVDADRFDTIRELQRVQQVVFNRDHAHEDELIDRLENVFRRGVQASAFALGEMFGFDHEFQQRLLEARKESERLACIADYLHQLTGKFQVGGTGRRFVDLNDAKYWWN